MGISRLVVSRLRPSLRRTRFCNTHTHQEGSVPRAAAAAMGGEMDSSPILGVRDCLDIGVLPLDLRGLQNVRECSEGKGGADD